MFIEDRVEFSLAEEEFFSDYALRSIADSRPIVSTRLQSFVGTTVTPGVRELMKRYDERSGYTRHTMDFTLEYIVDVLKIQRDVKPPPKLSDSDPLQLIQDALNVLEPKSAILETAWHGEMFHREPLTLTHEVEFLKTDLLENSVYSGRKYYPSKVFSMVGMPRRQTTKELIHSMAARNFDPPQESGDIDTEALAKEVIDYWKHECARPDIEEFLNVCKENPIRFDTRAMADSLSRMPGKKIKQLLSGDILSWEWTDTGQLKVTVKTKPKPKVKFSGMYPEIQTIIFNPGDINMTFTSQFNELHRRIVESLPPNIRFASRVSEKDVGDWATKFSRLGERYRENDYSKYDKGEGYNVMPLERAFYLMFGMEIHEADLWFSGQDIGVIRAVSFLFKLHLELQRRSGQLSTLLGNTVVCMLTVWFVYRIKRKDVNWALIKGDDSIVAYRALVPYVPGVSERLMFLFGLMGKPEEFKHGYCASRFFIHTTDGIQWVYDPVLLAVKLGAWLTPADFAVLGEKYDSYKLFADEYLDYEVRLGLTEAMLERYSLPVSSGWLLLSGLIQVLSSEKEFRSVWQTEGKTIGT